MPRKRFKPDEMIQQLQEYEGLFSPGSECGSSQPAYREHVWSDEYVHDRTHDG
jgi:hypothetical protein